MADERIVKVTIKSEYDGKGEVNAKKGLKNIEKQVQQTGEASKKKHARCYQCRYILC